MTNLRDSSERTTESGDRPCSWNHQHVLVLIDRSLYYSGAHSEIRPGREAGGNRIPPPPPQSIKMPQTSPWFFKFSPSFSSLISLSHIFFFNSPLFSNSEGEGVRLLPFSYPKYAPAHVHKLSVYTPHLSPSLILAFAHYSYNQKSPWCNKKLYVNLY